MVKTCQRPGDVLPKCFIGDAAGDAVHCARKVERIEARPIDID
jgi:hypothetical protein